MSHVFASRSRSAASAWLVSLTALAAFPAQAEDADAYDLWRRMKVDICQTLPTREEIACMTANAGELPNSGTGVCDFDATIEACLESEQFAEMVGTWVDDFALPSEAPNRGTHAWLKYNFTSYETSRGASSLMYYYSSSNNGTWTDCLADVIQPLASEAEVTSYLDKLYDPYWNTAYIDRDSAGIQNDAGGDFVYVCKQTETRSSACGDSGDYTASLANENPVECDIGGVERACNQSSKLFPCGCGPNGRWCLLMTDFTNNAGTARTAANSAGYYGVVTPIKEETRRFVTEVVLRENGLIGSSARFTDIFNATYAFRTSRLQHFYELHQSNWADDSQSDDCFRLISGIEKGREDSVCDSGSLTGSIPFIDRVRTNGSSPAAVRLDSSHRDWQVIDLTQSLDDGSQPLAYQHFGILGNNQIMRRQPSEPNLANRIYSYWLCEDPNWKLWSLSKGSSVTEPYDYSVVNDWGTAYFSTLERTTEALVPFDETTDSNDTCKGCHLTVNQIAPFRNKWDSQGRYRYTDRESYGALLGQTGDDIAGLGEIMADSDVVHACIVNRVAEQLTGEFFERGSSELNDIVTTFTNSNFDIRTVYRAVLATDQYRRPR